MHCKSLLWLFTLYVHQNAQQGESNPMCIACAMIPGWSNCVINYVVTGTVVGHAEGLK